MTEHAGDPKGKETQYRDTSYQEIVEASPFNFTTTIAAKPVVPGNYPYLYVLGYEIRIRSMGTATYVAFGDATAQNVRLLAADQRLKYQCMRYQVIDLTKKYVSCDTADAVVEVMYTLIPFKQYGLVKKVV